ncbi:MAG TPA: ComF family protein [Gammaproteobacteria bacterium]|nr:ComF family protein [Gammaproteobacteria bacterium]
MILHGLFRGKPRILGKNISRWLSAGCLLCGDPASGELCTACFHDLPWNDHACAHCALPLPPLATELCGACSRSSPEFDEAYAAFHYAWPVDRLLRQFKFRGHLARGHMLSGALAEYLDMRRATHPDVLLPIPLHRRRLASRGFNQAAEIARALGKSLDVPVAYDALHRLRATPAQRGLGRKARRANLKGAFGSRQSLAGLHVGLVDDVVTTTSTTNAAAHAVARAGAARISVYALARA